MYSRQRLLEGILNNEETLEILEEGALNRAGINLRNLHRKLKPGKTKLPKAGIDRLTKAANDPSIPAYKLTSIGKSKQVHKPTLADKLTPAEKIRRMRKMSQHNSKKIWR